MSSLSSSSLSYCSSFSLSQHQQQQQTSSSPSNIIASTTALDFSLPTKEERSLIYLLRDRFFYWRSIFEGQSKFYDEYSSLLFGNLKSIKKMSTFLLSKTPPLPCNSNNINSSTSTSTTTTATTLNQQQIPQVMLPLSHLNKSINVELESLHSFLTKTTIPSFKEIEKEGLRSIQDMENLLDTSLKGITALRSNLKSSIKKHENFWIQRTILSSRLYSDQQSLQSSSSMIIGSSANSSTSSNTSINATNNSTQSNPFTLSTDTDDMLNKFLSTNRDSEDLFLSENRIKITLSSLKGEEERHSALLKNLYSRIYQLEQDFTKRLYYLSKELSLIRRNAGDESFKSIEDSFVVEDEEIDDCGIGIGIGNGLEILSNSWNASLVRFSVKPLEEFVMPSIFSNSSDILCMIWKHIGSLIPGSRGPLPEIDIKRLAIIHKTPSRGLFSRSNIGSNGGSTYLKENSFIAVLVGSAFLHCYPIKDEKILQFFEQPTKLSFGSTLSTLNQYIKSSFDAVLTCAESPSFSVNLLHPETFCGIAEFHRSSPSVQSRRSSPSGTVVSMIAGGGGGSASTKSTSSTPSFDWIISVPGSSGFFGRSEKTLRLSSFTEEDMVDWCISIKDCIGKPIPSLPLPVNTAASSADGIRDQSALYGKSIDDDDDTSLYNAFDSAMSFNVVSSSVSSSSSSSLSSKTASTNAKLTSKNSTFTTFVDKIEPNPWD